MQHSTKVFTQVVFGLALLLLAKQFTATATQPRGYALGFQAQSIAGIRNGWIDFSDPGFQNVNQTFSMAFWMKVYHHGYLLSIADVSDPSHFSPVFYDGSLMFSKSLTFQNFPLQEWAHFAVTVDPVDGIKVFINGVVAGQLGASDSHTLRKSEKMTLSIGAHLYSFQDSIVTTGRHNSFKGEIDDLGLWSRKLTSSQIQQLIDTSMSQAEITSDSDLVLYYNFDLACTNDADPCFESYVGDEPIARNLGVAGSKYDLLLGRLNNDYNRGKAYILNSATGSKRVPVPFDLPLPTKSTQGTGIAGYLGVPQVLYARVAVGRVEVKLDSSLVFKISKLPSYGYIYSTSTSTTPIETVGHEFRFTPSIYYEATGVDTDWIEFAVTSLFKSSDPVQHQVHFWRFKTPKLYAPGGVATDMELVGLEDKNSGFFLCRTFSCFLTPPGPHQIVLHKTTVTGKLDWLNESLRVFTASPLSRSMHSAALVYYSPPMDVYGKNVDRFSIALLDNRFGAEESEQVEVLITLQKVNDLPTVQPRSIDIVEGDAQTTPLLLNGSDVEIGSVGIGISKIPQKGSLYTIDDEGVETEVSQAYLPYAVGTVFEQYAYEVVNVSSFWGVPPGVSYHPMGILGRPNCYGWFGDCAYDHRFEYVDGQHWTLVVDDIVHVNRYAHEPHRPALFVVGRIEQVFGTGINATYNVNVLPLYKRVNSADVELSGCFMESISFPQNCNETEFNVRNGTFKLHHVTPSGFVSSPNMVMGGMNAQYTDKQVLDNGDLSAAYGKQYSFRNFDASQLYESSDPPYSEFIELKFKTPAYLVDIEIGQPRGGGCVVRIKVMNPQGVWDTVFEDRPNHADHERSTGVEQYYWFGKPVCRPFYKLDHIRIEWDTSAETGILDYNFFDYVKLIGSESLQPAALPFPINSLKYKPDEHAEGLDSFEYFATDCGANRFRSSEPVEYTINIAPVPDPPTAKMQLVGRARLDESGESELVSFDSTWNPSTDLLGSCGESSSASSNQPGSSEKNPVVVAPGYQVFVKLEGSDVDLGDSVELRITDIHQPAGNGTNTLFQLHIESAEDLLHPLSRSQRVITSSRPLETVQSSSTWTSMISVHAEQCPSLSLRKWSFDYMVIDESGRNITRAVHIATDCTTLPATYKFQQVSGGARALSTTLGVVGICISVAAIVFNTTYRSHPVVRMTSWRINVFICVAAIAVYLNLVFAGRSLGENPNCHLKDFILDPLLCNKGENPTCCETESKWQCKVPPVLSATGIVLVFSMLIGKTDRVIRILVSEDFLRTRILKDREVVLEAFAISLPVLILQYVQYNVGNVFVAASVKFANFDQDQQQVSYEVHSVCQSDLSDLISGGIVAYIAIIVMYGVVQAFKVKDVHIKQANDSWSIAISVYNTMAFGSINLALQYGLPASTAKHTLSALLTFIAMTITIVALFGVRAFEVYKKVNRVTIMNGKTGDTNEIVVAAGEY